MEPLLSSQNSSKSNLDPLLPHYPEHATTKTTSLMCHVPSHPKMLLALAMVGIMVSTNAGSLVDKDLRGKFWKTLFIPMQTTLETGSPLPKLYLVKWPLKMWTFNYPIKIRPNLISCINNIVFYRHIIILWWFVFGVITIQVPSMLNLNNTNNLI